MDVPLSPAVFSLRQYYKILIEEPSYLKLFCNSAMYTAAILVGQGLVIPLTAYALSRFEFRGKNALMVLIMMLMVLPFQVTMGAQRDYPAYPGADGYALGGYPAHDLFTVLYFSAAPVYGGAAQRGCWRQE